MQKTEKANLQSVFSHRLLIPSYQRAYSWKTKQVRQFFEDIEYAVKNNFEDSPNEYHYFGTIVLEEKDEKYKSGGSSVKEYDIVDGQQRLITTTILVRVLVDLIPEISENNRLDTEEVDVDELVEELESQFIQKSGMNRLEPEDISKDAYDSIVINGELTETFESLAGRNIKNAYETLFGRVTEYLDEYSDDTSEDVNEPLLKLIRTLKSEFRLTPNILKDMNEASRMFKVINDRGKDLTPIDKIKSHLMYCCTFLDDFKPEKVSRLINKSIQEITEVPESTEEDIQEFTRIHWYLFTGEKSDDWHKSHSKYDFDSRADMLYFERLQEIPFYASTSRDPQSLRKFVGHYVKSMNELVGSYLKYKYPEYAASKGLISPEIGNSVYAIHQASNRFMHGVYMTGLFYAISDKRQKTAIDIALSPAIRYNMIMKSHGSFKRNVVKQGHKAFWVRYESQSEISKSDMFGNRRHNIYEIPDSEISWIQETEDIMSKKVSEKCSDEAVLNFLEQPDVLGGEFTDGWGGFRSTKVAKILLYYYEDSLRDDALVNHKTLAEWCEELELEHILPVNPRKGEAIPHHNEQVNRLGNLLMLTPELNQSAQNKNYSTKIEKIYPSSYNSLEMVRNLNDKNWSSEEIKRRTQLISESTLNRF